MSAAPTFLTGILFLSKEFHLTETISSTLSLWSGLTRLRNTALTTPREFPLREGGFYFGPAHIPKTTACDLPLKFHPAAIRASAVFDTPKGVVGATGGNVNLPHCVAFVPVAAMIPA
ncbi:hypothetical protein AGR2A_pa40161 [Agrobacterium genomosp. 2 str. CFBP 5494]|uniref:Uncharacterized protein n=1 Tax=Agrobacterium genomosp. 2 str. CFBP 5494 TaxID=1183436 RepID=A0A9W5B718_9HYPH|nr:hypothetical protein AGR2A_pa40161 [Agrobacterium genomosp. 2 str. CFBP 5494]